MPHRFHPAMLGLLIRHTMVHWEAQNLPPSAASAVDFFSAAEVHERAGGVAYTEWRFSLPRELTRDQQMDAARDLLHAACAWRTMHQANSLTGAAAWGRVAPLGWLQGDGRGTGGCGRNVHS